MFKLFFKTGRAALPCRTLLLSLLAGLLFSDGEGISLLPFGHTSTLQSVASTPDILPDQIVGNASGAAKQAKAKERDLFQSTGSGAAILSLENNEYGAARPIRRFDVNQPNTRLGRVMSGRAPPSFNSRISQQNVGTLALVARSSG